MFTSSHNRDDLAVDAGLQSPFASNPAPADIQSAIEAADRRHSRERRRWAERRANRRVGPFNDTPIIKPD